jgi:hypothetical protein
VSKMSEIHASPLGCNNYALITSTVRKFPESKLKMNEVTGSRKGNIMPSHYLNWPIQWLCGLRCGPSALTHCIMGLNPAYRIDVCPWSLCCVVL